MMKPLLFIETNNFVIKEQINDGSVSPADI